MKKAKKSARSNNSATSTAEIVLVIAGGASRLAVVVGAAIAFIYAVPTNWDLAGGIKILGLTILGISSLLYSRTYKQKYGNEKPYFLRPEIIKQEENKEWKVKLAIFAGGAVALGLFFQPWAILPLALGGAVWYGVDKIFEAETCSC